MKNNTKKLMWMSTGCLFALLSGIPVLADDTELLLVEPDASEVPFDANILLIVDSSGSMGSLERTRKPYDGTVTYGGACDATKVYWSQIDVVPACGGDESRAQSIDKSSFVCRSSEQKMLTVGLYTDTMVQYRSETDESSRWTTLKPGNASDIVECQQDSGFHGEDGSSASYAQAGSGLPKFTANPALEIAWGSYPTSETYTVYDGNYLNWRANPEFIDLSRIEIVKAAAKVALASISRSNIGIMRFNNGEGGTVILTMTGLDDNRSDIDSVIDAIEIGSGTPLAESVYEAALYWLGAPAEFGGADYPTDPDALASLRPDVYRQPESLACTKNYNVLLSDGAPTADDKDRQIVPTLPNFADRLGRSACTWRERGDCLDDVTEYLSIPDLAPQQPGEQFVTTHTIGFRVDLPILKDAAEVSGGEYFLADDIESLTLALIRIFDIANKQSLAFTAPSVAVNTFNRTQNRNDLFMTVFSAETRTHWPGNLKKYAISGGRIVDATGAEAVDPATGFFADSARSIWTAGAPDGSDVRSGGAASLLPDPLSRKLYTYNGASRNLTAASNAISPANAAAYRLTDFGLTGAAGEPSKIDIINWARGADLRDEDNDPDTLQRFAMGDPLHAQPAAIDYGTSENDSDVVVYFATNDGYLHAVDGDTGVELWSFVPRDMLGRFGKLYFDQSTRYKSYGLDGNVVPVVADRNNNGFIDGDDFVYIIFGMRRGGDKYMALDVTDRNSPRLLWEKTLPGFGQTWSAPVVARVDIDDAGLNSNKAVAIIGGGYDPVHDTPSYPATPDLEGAGIFMLDLETGDVIWRAGSNIDADLRLDAMTRSIPNAITVIDLDGNRIADRMYAADVGGQIWRFDLFPGKPPATAVTGGVVARIGAEGIEGPTAADTRRVYNTPDVALFEDPIESRRFLSVSIGTGYRAHPLNTTAADRFYSFRDENVFTRLSQTEYDNYVVATDSDFVEVSGETNVVIQAPARGWKLTLPANEAVLTDSRTFDGKVFFVTFAPDRVAADECSVRVGRNFLYSVSVVNGDPLVNNLDQVLDPDAERKEDLQQGGIAPTPRFLFPSAEEGCTGAACNPPPIGCVGVECFDPGFRPGPVRTLWTQDGIE